ncbi:sugar transport protein 13 [Tanacetum coccineum]
MMNPSCEKVADVEEDLWSNKDASPICSIFNATEDKGSVRRYYNEEGSTENGIGCNVVNENLESARNDPLVHDMKQSFSRVVTNEKPKPKDKVTSVPVWVKMHKVPIVAYYEDGLSLISTQVGKPIMLDAFTSEMCADLWGRLGFARALIEVSADKDLKQEVVIVVPKVDESSKEKGESSKVKLTNPYEVLATQDDQDVDEPCIRKVTNKVTPDPDPIIEDSDCEVKEIFFDKRKGATLSKVCSKVFRYWEWTSNASLCDKGCRIILGWNIDIIDLMVISQSNQAMHVKFVHKFSNQSLFVSFIYAANLPTVRRVLWHDLRVHKQVTCGSLWVLMGDFNIALNLEDYHSGPSTMSSTMVEFKDCVYNLEVMDLNSTGMHYTWNQKPKEGGGVLKKLDRIMSNIEFMDSFPGAYAIFQPYRIFDNSPAVLKIPGSTFNKPKLFKFFNFISFKINFLEVVSNSWNNHVNGHNMFKVVSKLKALKKSLRKMVYDQGNLHDHVNNLRRKLDEVQKALDANPEDLNLKEEEAIYLQSFNEAKLDEERFLQQKAKIEWLEDVVGAEVCDAVRDFFLNGQILKEINHTFIALIPKIPTPLRLNDYRPISCCSVIYKCISKILTNRIIKGVMEVVSKNQSAFIPRRNISDNILITQELMHNYHRKRGPPRCAFKVDIQKAYDMVDWRFLENILEGFGFYPTMIKWILACVTSTSFSISLNGDIHGYFKGKRGLRQCDPLSPYLFTLVMEVLTLMLKRRVYLSESFRYHHHCENLQIINICFADDLFLFARGNVESAMVIMESLDEFKSTSGLVPSVLPIKYLGVPLISSRLLNKDCKVLVEQAKCNIPLR